ncbi:Polycystin-1 [Manis javanica]|nr:Polycystin-1 [Manis javanica]
MSLMPGHYQEENMEQMLGVLKHQSPSPNFLTRNLPTFLQDYWASIWHISPGSEEPHENVSAKIMLFNKVQCFQNRDCMWVTVTFPMPVQCPEHRDAQQMVDRSKMNGETENQLPQVMAVMRCLHNIVNESELEVVADMEEQAETILRAGEAATFR